jgi:hypothetical protein
LKPAVERRLGRKASFESVLMALRRANFARAKDLTAELKRAVARSNYSVHGGVNDVVLDYKLATLKRIIAAASERKMEGEAFTFIVGVKYASLVTDNAALAALVEEKEGEDVVAKKSGLAVFRVLLDERDVKLPGIIALFSREFAKQGVGVVELASAHTEIGFVIDERDLKKAIDAYALLKERMK